MINNNKAVIWDMDGVIADTAPYHFIAWQRAFNKRGVEFNDEDFKHSFGRRNDAIIRGILGDNVLLSEIEVISVEKENLFRDSARQKIKAFPGAVELMKELHEHGFSQALASSAPFENVKLILETLGIEDYFKAIVSDREVTEGKPSPQGFLLAAEKLGVEPKDCVVIEDAVAGVTAAKRAVMLCVAVTNTHPADKLKEADLIVGTLEQVSADNLEKLLGQRKQQGVEMERSLVLIKPDAMERNLGCTILSRIESNGLKLIAQKMLHVDKELAHRHYAVHKGKPFFEGLIAYITSTPIIAAAFQGENAIQRIRDIMGATDPAKAAPGTIRRDFGVSIERNSVHGSDSKENGEKEVSLFFNPAEIYDR